MAYLEINGVSKSYGQGAERTEVLRDVNLHMEKEEFVAVVGFSGSGKTTLISLVAGLIRPDEGEVVIDGRRVEGPSPDRALVFQNYSLLPWLTVYGNVALAVDRLFAAWPPAKRRDHVEKHIAMVNLSPALDKRPAELSGGMRQRVAVARTLAMDPGVLLMDEPLGALDALTRGTLQAEIENIWRSQRKTALLITNDVDEGILLADRIVPLKPGPRATLGPSFPVGLPRPRDRAELNTTTEYKVLRNAVNNYLLDLRPGRELVGRHAKHKEIVLPDLEPVDLSA